MTFVGIEINTFTIKTIIDNSPVEIIVIGEVDPFFKVSNQFCGQEDGGVVM